MNLTFFESRGFTARWRSRADDSALRRLQNDLLDVPDRGKEMPGCGILRKYRVADPSRGKGKRGGLRVIYLHTPAVSRIDLLAVYGKDEKADLSKSDIKILCEMARLIRQEAMAMSAKGDPK